MKRIAAIFAVCAFLSMIFPVSATTNIKIDSGQMTLESGVSGIVTLTLDGKGNDIIVEE